MCIRDRVDGVVIEVFITVAVEVANVSFIGSVDWYVDCSVSVFGTLVDGMIFEVNVTVVANVSFSDSVDRYVDCSVSVFWTLVD